jgi:hypothetical protein
MPVLNKHRSIQEVLKELQEEEDDSSDDEGG